MNNILDQKILLSREAYYPSAKTLYRVLFCLNIAQKKIIKDISIQNISIQIPANYSLFEKLYQILSHLNSAENNIINNLLEKEISLNKLSSTKLLQSISKWNIPILHNQYSKSDIFLFYRNQKRAQILYCFEEQSEYIELFLPEIIQVFRSQAVPESITTNEKIRSLLFYSEQFWETPSITGHRLSKGWLEEVYLWKDREWNIILELVLDKRKRFNLVFERY